MKNPHIDKFGTNRWYNESGQLHRQDGPAAEWVNGHKEWYLNGKRHREDGPAIEYADGTKYWYLNGKRHREDDPATELENGDKFWFLNGQHLSFEEWQNQIILLNIKKVRINFNKDLDIPKSFSTFTM